MIRSSEGLTVVVMTYNRYPRLLRLLRYIASVQLPYAVHILDSSSEAAPSELSHWLRVVGASYHTYHTDTPPMHKLRDGVSRVSTPYVVQWADDDFLVPRGLAEGVQWLRTHADYRVVHGLGVLLVLEGSGEQHLGSCMPYWQRAVLQETAAERLSDQLSHHSVLNYSIYRTDDFTRHVETCCRHDFGYTWAELAWGALAVIPGKAMQLNQLYLIKEAHPGPDAWITWLRRTEQSVRVPDVFDWITEEAFPNTYIKFRDCLAHALVQQDGMRASVAVDIVRDALWSYVANVLTKKRIGRSNGSSQQSLSVQWRSMARRIPGLRSAWRHVRAVMPRGKTDLSLDGLRRPSSPYYTDFAPVDRVMTEEMNDVIPDEMPVGVEAV